MRRTRQHQAKNRNRIKVIALAVGGVVLLAAGIWAGQTYLMDGGGRRSVRAADAGGLKPERIAVLYFNDLTPDKRLAYLADGLTESLIRTLSGVAGLDVISTGGVKQFRGTEVSRDSIARVLQAGTLVEGTVEPVGDRVRVNVRLVEGNSGVDLERTSVTEPLGDPLLLSGRLTENIATLLRESLGEEVRLRELRAGTKNPVAWSLVQRAEKLRKDAEALEQARNAAGASKLLFSADTLLAEAEGRDPRWVEPIVLRGAIAGRQEQLTRDRTEMSKWIDIGLAHAARALALDPRDASALELRGTLRVRRIGRELITDQRAREDSINAAENDLREAIRVNPSQAVALNVLSGIQYAKPDVVEAHNLARRAYEADAYLAAAPAILWRLYVTSYDLGSFENAERWCAEEARRFPQHLFSARCKLWIMTTKVVRPEPAEAWQRAAALERAAPTQQAEYYRREAQIVVAAVLARAGLADSARRVLVRARAGPEVDPRGELIGYEAFVRALLGDKKEAVDLIQQYLTDHPEHRRGFAKINPWWWRGLEDDPRFRTLMAVGG